MYTSCHNYGLNYGDVDKGHRANGFTTDGGFCEYQVNNTLHTGTLAGMQVVAVVNIGERRIAGFVSQVLVLGAMPSPTEVVLLAPRHAVENGTRIG